MLNSMSILKRKPCQKTLIDPSFNTKLTIVFAAMKDGLMQKDLIAKVVHLNATHAEKSKENIDVAICKCFKENNMDPNLYIT